MQEEGGVLGGAPCPTHACRRAVGELHGLARRLAVTLVHQRLQVPWIKRQGLVS
jgi:hypothetical protein